MGRLIVKFSNQKNQLFPLEDGEIVIGRGDEAGLKLPNVSVSRRHARILVEGEQATIEDLESQNGILVNGEAVKQHVLKSQDEIQVGKFSLVYLGSGRDDRFYKGRYVSYLPRYEPSSIMPDTAATFALTKEALAAMANDNSVMEHARFVSEESTDRYWYPEDRGLTFGGGGLVPAKGWFTWGVAAEVSWDGKRHVIEKKGWLVHVSVNNAGVTKRPLRDGDRVRIGGSAFRYEVAD